jgi:hypothetical protein
MENPTNEKSGLGGNATSTESRTVTCELAHISPRSSGPKYGFKEAKAMTQFTQHPARIPQWLKNDLLIIAVSVAIMGSLAWIAPF